MWTFYFISLLPIVVGIVLWIRSRRVAWQELVGSAALSLILAITFNLIAFHGMTSDEQTLSGRIMQVEHHPRWVERWIQHHSETYYTGSGKNRVSHTRHWTTVEHDTHPEHWEANFNFGSFQENRDIDFQKYTSIKSEFGNHVETGSKQSYNHGGTFESGDQNTYVTDNRTGFIRPVTTTDSFENRIKAAPSVFSFTKVPTNAPVFNWPDNPNTWVSDRVMGTARGHINLYEWDKLNAVLGPKKHINLVIVGFNSDDSMLGQYQQAKWIGGKKNDFVITFGGTGEKPTWAYCFGWTESDICKRTVESYIIEHGVNADIYKFLNDEITQNYKIKDWTKFDYISIEPDTRYYVWFFIVNAIVQGGLWFWFFRNGFDKYKNY